MNGEDKVTFRPPAIAELEVDTVDRYRNTEIGFITALTTPTTSSSVLFETQQSLLSGYFNRIALSEIQFHYKVPNVNPYNNRINIFTSNRSDGSTGGYATTIPVGFYDMPNLGSTIAGLLSGSGDGPFIYTPIDSGTSNEAINISTTNPSTLWAFSSVDTPRNIPKIGKFYKMAGITKNNFAVLQGFTASNLSTNQTFGQTTNLNYTDYIDIVSDRLAKFAKVKDGMTRQYQGQGSVLARLYLTPFGSKERFGATNPYTFSIDYTTPKYIRWNPDEYINNFDITLYDEFGELVWCDPINYPQYISEYQFTLQASET